MVGYATKHTLVFAHQFSFREGLKLEASASRGFFMPAADLFFETLCLVHFLFLAFAEERQAELEKRSCSGRRYRSHLFLNTLNKS